jgi:hypothetical protein
VITAKARIPREGDHSPVLSVVVPDLSEARAFVHLHATGKRWEGEIFGWQAEYTPERRKKPPASKMRFTPATSWIGESAIWFCSLLWEHGRDEKPAEFPDDRGMVKT